MVHPFGTQPDPREPNPCVFTVVVTKATLARLEHSAAELSDGREVWQLASDAVDEYVLGIYRNRNDDPGRSVGADR